MKFIKSWLSEKSTWMGIFALLASFNITTLTQEQQLAVAAVGISLVARNETKKE